MSSVLGIDLNTKAIDLVKLDETTNAATWTRVDLVGKTALERLRNIESGFDAADRERTYFDDVYLVAIEAPMSHGQPGSLAKLSRVFGAVVAFLPSSLEMWEVSPTAWRKELGLSGNASKEECAKAVGNLLRLDWERGLPRAADTGASGPALTPDEGQPETPQGVAWSHPSRGITGDLGGPLSESSPTWPQDALDAYAVAYYARQVNARGIAA